jgi:hypothetical protein
MGGTWPRVEKVNSRQLPHNFRLPSLGKDAPEIPNRPCKIGARNGDNSQSRLGIAGSRLCTAVDTPCSASGHKPADAGCRCSHVPSDAVSGHFSDRRLASGAKPGGCRGLFAPVPHGSQPASYFPRDRHAASGFFCRPVLWLSAPCRAFQSSHSHSEQPRTDLDSESATTDCLTFRFRRINH